MVKRFGDRGIGILKLCVFTNQSYFNCFPDIVMPISEVSPLPHELFGSWDSNVQV